MSMNACMPCEPANSYCFLWGAPFSCSLVAERGARAVIRCRMDLEESPSRSKKLRPYVVCAYARGSAPPPAMAADWSKVQREDMRGKLLLRREVLLIF